MTMRKTHSFVHAVLYQPHIPHPPHAHSARTLLRLDSAAINRSQLLRGHVDSDASLPTLSNPRNYVIFRSIIRSTSSSNLLPPLPNILRVCSLRDCFCFVLKQSNLWNVLHAATYSLPLYSVIPALPIRWVCLAISSECELRPSVLHPGYKLQYFRKHKWPQSWIDEVTKLVQDEWKQYRPTAVEASSSSQQPKTKVRSF